MTVPSSKHGASPSAAGSSSGFADASWGNVFCRYGIHSGWFPIAGMRLGDVRPILVRLIDMDPEAVAIVNGRRLSEDDIIGDGVEFLNFIKRPSIMG